MFQGEYLIIANVGDSRAVLATTSENGTLTPIQLTTDLKPNLPSIYTLSNFYTPSQKDLHHTDFDLNPKISD